MGAGVSVSERVTLLVFAGCSREDDETPFMVGAFNEEYLNQLPLEDAEEQIARMKETWTFDPEQYDWREIRVSIPVDALDAAFDRVEVDGRVDPADAEESAKPSRETEL